MKNLTVAGRPVTELVRLWDFPGHQHSQDDRAGYILRQTQRDGVWLWHDEFKSACGVDVAVFDGPCTFGAALDSKRAMEGDGQYFVIDSVYACGCRTGS